MDRDVDRHPEIRQLGRPSPLRKLVARGFEDPGAHLDDVTRLLGDSDEVRRADQPTLWVPPSDQRLRAADAAVRKTHDRLIPEFELLTVQGVMQITDELESLVRP